MLEFVKMLLKPSRVRRPKKACHCEILEQRLLLTDFDDSISEAISLGDLSSSAGTRIGDINPTTDVDVYRIDAVQGQELSLFVIGTGAMYPKLRLYGPHASFSTLQELGTSLDGQVLKVPVHVSGAYYIGISEQSNEFYNIFTGDFDSVSPGANTGGYRLTYGDTAESVPANVRGTSFNLDALSYRRGRTYTIDFTIENEGGENVSGFDVEFFVSNNSFISFSDTKLATTRINFLAAGTSYSGSISVLLPLDFDLTVDQATFGMIIDTQDELTESSNSDNQNRGTGLDKETVTLVPPPDTSSPDDIIGWDATVGVWRFGASDGNRIDENVGPTWDTSLDWDIHYADFTGDGVTDIAGRTAAGEWYVISGSTRQSRVWGTWASNAVAGWSHVDVGDFNADGRKDVIGLDSQGRWQVSLSYSSGFTTPEVWSSVSTTGWTDHRVGDFNGDLRTDIVHFADSGQRWVSESTGTGFQLDYYGRVSSQAVAGWQNFMVGDFNGDGLDDILQQSATFNGQWWKGTSQAIEDGAFITSYVNRWAPGAFKNYLISDFNGDGKDDLLGQTHNNQLWVNRTLLNGRMNAEYWAGFSPSADVNITIGDFDGDGNADVVGHFTVNGQFYFQRSNGTNRFQNQFFGRWISFLTDTEIYSGDIFA